MKTTPKVKIIGVGGAGGNALLRIFKYKTPAMNLIAVNTDSQDLRKTKADFKLRIGRETTQGLGTGMNPEIGRKAAEEQREEIKQLLQGSDLVFITAGFGGGTGSGAAPVVAEIAKNLGILTVAVISKPFSFEGASRKTIAQQGIKEISDKVDSLILISNDRLVSLAEKNTPLTKAFLLGDEILKQAVFSVIDLILRPSLVAISFADIKSVLQNSGQAFFGRAEAQGPNRAQEASLKVLNSPLLEMSPYSASRILFNVSARNLKLAEIDIVSGLITKNILAQTQVIFGAREDERLKPEQMQLTLIATGFKS